MESSKYFVFIPKWAKAAVLSISLIIVILAGSISIYFTLNPGDNSSDIIILSLGIIQAISSLMLIAFIIFFAEKGNVARRVRQETQYFLRNTLTTSCSLFPWHEVFSVESNTIDIHASSKMSYGFGTIITISTTNIPLAKIWIGINVHKLIYILFVETPKDTKAEQLKAVLSETMIGANKSGWKVTIQLHNDRPSKRIFSVWGTVSDEDPNMLTNGHRSLFWANDIAMFTFSILSSLARSPYRPHTETLPHPL